MNAPPRWRRWLSPWNLFTLAVLVWAAPRLLPHLGAVAGVRSGGNARPSYRVATLAGDTLGSESLRGQVVLVNFWATWCGPCVEEMPLLERWHREAGDRLQVIGVALDDPEEVRRFVADTGVSYPILLDAPGPTDASVRFGDTRGVLPYSVLIDARGRIIDRQMGSFHEESLKEWLAPVLD